MKLDKVILDNADEVTKPILKGTKEKMGMITNMFR